MNEPPASPVPSTAGDPRVEVVGLQAAQHAAVDAHGLPFGSSAVTRTGLSPRVLQRSSASLAVTRSRYGPRVNGVSAGPRRYEIQYQIVQPTPIAQTATSMPSAPSATRARVRRRWSSSSRGVGSAGVAISRKVDNG